MKLVLVNTLTNTIEETRNITGMDAMERHIVEQDMLLLAGDPENFRVEVVE